MSEEPIPSCNPELTELAPNAPRSYGLAYVKGLTPPRAAAPDGWSPEGVRIAGEGHIGLLDLKPVETRSSQTA